MDGTKLITVHDPISLDDGNLELALHGSFLPGCIFLSAQLVQLCSNCFLNYMVIKFFD